MMLVLKFYTWSPKDFFTPFRTSHMKYLPQNFCHSSCVPEMLSNPSLEIDLSLSALGWRIAFSNKVFLSPGKVVMVVCITKSFAIWLERRLFFECCNKMRQPDFCAVLLSDFSAFPWALLIAFGVFNALSSSGCT